MQFYPEANFTPMFAFPAGQASPLQYPEGQYRGHPGYHGIPYIYSYQQPRNTFMGEHASLVDGKTESKPRLTKEEVDRLEKEFRKNPKPSSSVKAGLAECLGLERARINNWFQNRRAKAKQEKKQEEYEARRAAEQDPSESASPQEYSLSDSPDCFNENSHQLMKPSSALFPDVSSHISSTTADSTPEEDDDDSLEESKSPDFQRPCSHKDDASDTFSTQLPVDFSSPEMMGFPDTQGVESFDHDASPDRLASPFVSLNQTLESASTTSPHYAGLVSSNLHAAESEHLGFQFQNIVGAGFTNSSAVSSHGRIHSGVNNMENSGRSIDAHEGLTRGPSHGEHPQNTPSPDDSFKSPPPPANIASRRNLSHRPATLQAVALKTRSHGPKTLDGSIHRIASLSGSGPGRIQKSSAGPRSPMSNSKQEAFYRQYQHGGPLTAHFPIAAPPTPMTPAVITQEPTVSNCSDDDALVLGGMPSGYLQGWDTEANLKTPPQSPGMLGNFGASTNFMAHYLGEQQVFTPCSQSGFSEFSPVPGYVDGSDGSQPATPLYPHVVSLAHPQNTPFTNGQGRTEYDWDATKPVMSKSPPGHARSRMLQFAKNVTPRNYPHSQER